MPNDSRKIGFAINYSLLEGLCELPIWTFGECCSSHPRVASHHLCRRAGVLLLDAIALGLLRRELIGTSALTVARNCPDPIRVRSTDGRGERKSCERGF